jgi:hypothetical protein
MTLEVAGENIETPRRHSAFSADPLSWKRRFLRVIRQFQSKLCSSRPDLTKQFVDEVSTGVFMGCQIKVDEYLFSAVRTLSAGVSGFTGRAGVENQLLALPRPGR